MKYNVYCDESCHLEHDDSNIMVIGSIWCDRDKKKEFYDAIRKIKIKHGLSSWMEIKWTKASPSKLDFYEEVLDYFINNPNLHYRGIVATGKEKLNHKKYNQGNHDLWYYKMYYYMLNKIMTPPDEYFVFIDIKDTCGESRVNKLHEVLCNNQYDFNSEVIHSIKQINSTESELLQLADLINGAVAYTNRKLSSCAGASTAKIALVNKLMEHYPLDKKSSFYEQKFNLFIWEGRE